MASLISLEGVTKIYRTGTVAVPALRGVNITVERGEFLSVMGSSGSGKSTLMNIVGCLDRPTSGRYLLADQDVSKLDRNQLAEIRNRFLGFVFQSFNLLSRTSALENVELPLLYSGVSGRERKKRAKEALERVGLGDRIDHHPNQLSGGQQQRVALARAIVTKPPLIVADEPTGNLDSRTSVEVMQLFQELSKEDMTLLLVTHEPDIARYTGRVISMKDGVVRSDVKQEAMVADPSTEEAVAEVSP